MVKLVVSSRWVLKPNFSVTFLDNFLDGAKRMFLLICSLRNWNCLWLISKVLWFSTFSKANKYWRLPRYPCDYLKCGFENASDHNSCAKIRTSPETENTPCFSNLVVVVDVFFLAHGNHIWSTETKRATEFRRVMTSWYPVMSSHAENYLWRLRFLDNIWPLKTFGTLMTYICYTIHHPQVEGAYIQPLPTAWTLNPL